MKEYVRSGPLTDADRDRITRYLDYERGMDEATLLLLKALAAERYWRELSLKTFFPTTTSTIKETAK